MALLILYHHVGAGRDPLAITPELFESHLDCFQECGARLLTVSELTAALAAGPPPARALCVTFDDGLASVVEEAAPRLDRRGQRATVFCVAGNLGGTSDWPSLPSWVPHRPLASPAALVDLAAEGFEIGVHGYDHAPLPGAAEHVLRRELVDAQTALEEQLGLPMSSFAYPYGRVPGAEGAWLVRETYQAACTTVPATLGRAPDVHSLPRVDAHYLRRPELLRRVVSGRGRGYLALRRTGRRFSRLARGTPE